jgi:hypothetical protein
MVSVREGYEMHISITRPPVTTPLPSPGKSKDMPPGLARRGLDLPPGIAKKLENGGTAPAGIAKRFPAATPKPGPTAEPSSTPETPPTSETATGTTSAGTPVQTVDSSASGSTSPILDVVV